MEAENEFKSQQYFTIASPDKFDWYKAPEDIEFDMELLDANNEEQMKIIEKIKMEKAEKEKAAAKKT